MSTRSTIAVKDEYNTFTIYRHCDGYPDTENGVLATLSLVLPFAWELPRFEAMDFSAAIIRAWKEHGGNIYCTKSHDSHGDTEYQYDVMFEGGRLLCRWCRIGGHRKTHVIWEPKQ